MTEAQQQPMQDGVIVARAGRYYRNVRYFIVLAMIAMGGWFLYDGYVGYPKENEAARAQNQKEPHNEKSIQLQRQLGYALPPIGLIMLGWFLYRSRGEIRLSGDVVNVPGHPPIPLQSIQRIDKRKWDRKGIAVIEYAGENGAAGRFVLDDFIYERGPVDQIFDRIQGYVQGMGGTGAAVESNEGAASDSSHESN